MRTSIAMLALGMVFLPIQALWLENAGSAMNQAFAGNVDANCRVHNRLPGGTTNVGSGTLVDVTSDGERGLILTCAHLFTEGAGKVVVQFPAGQSHGALVVAVDHKADLAALEIAAPRARPVQFSVELDAADELSACGFGGGGQFQCARGRVLGYSELPGQVSLRMAGAVRSGDSGGGVFDSQGRLCAVVWGESGGVTYASTGRPLAAFLGRILGSKRGFVTTQPSGSAANCPDGRCPLVAPAPIVGVPSGGAPGFVQTPAPIGAPSAAARPCDCDDKLAAIAARLEAMQHHGNATPSASTPASFSSAARTAAALAVGALGISGPTGLGVIAAGTLGGWLIGRRLKRRKLRNKGRQGLAAGDTQLATSSEATAAAEVSFPIERDDREARELLRLSQLEGRDPLQDAVAGRLALDRLDAIAESDADQNHSTWADRLRRELREKFNEIAPTTFRVPF